MAIFAIIPTSLQERLDKVVAEQFPNDSYRLPKGQWLIAYRGTSKELSDFLGITDQKVDPALVLSIGSYYGRAPTDIWEWIKVKLEEHDG